MKCPTCGHEIKAPEYDAADPIQKRGFDDTKHNQALKTGPYRNNPYSDGSDEYYRWNRGYHAACKN